MLEKELKSLPSETVRLIGSSQVITSIFSVVKELVENAFDADCTNLEIKLDNFGLDKVEVRDNGAGIHQDVMPMVAKRHHTSKISSFSDLESLETYGFRGEALGSLCAVSSLSVTSKTQDEDVSFTYTFDKQGNIVSKLPSHLGQGTTISAVNIFKNIPVRRQFYNTVKKKKEELKKVEDLLMAYGMIRPDVRIVLRNNKDIVWQKTVQAEIRSVFLGVFGRNATAQMVSKTATCHETKVQLDAFLPKTNCEVNVTSRSTNDRCFLAVNKRPVQLKDFEKVVKQHYCHHMKCDGRHPMFYISITVPSRDLDVNVDPNKTKVMLHEQASALKLMTSVLEELYGPIIKPQETEKRGTADKFNDSSLSDSSLDSSLDTSVSDKVDFRGRPCLKERTNNVDENRACARNKFNIVEHVQNKDTGQAHDGSSLVKKDADNVVQDVEELKEDSGNEPEILLGNRVVVHHTENGVRDGVDGPNEADAENIAHTSKDLNSNSEKLDSCSNSVNISSDTDHVAVTHTQVDNGSFAILDDDLEILLRTQSNFSKTGDIGKSLNDTDGLLADIDITMIGDIGELGKKVDNICNKNGGDMENVERNQSDNVLDWSKGTAEKSDKDGTVLQPVQLLAGGSHVTRKRPPSPNQDRELAAVTPPVKRKSSDFNSSFDQPKLYDIVGKSPAEKFSLGFLAFSKEMRPTVLEDNPDLNYDEITSKVRQLWQQLPDVDKKRYVDVGKVQVQDLKKKVSEKKKLAQKLDRRLQPVTGTPSIKDQLLASSKISAVQSVPVKSMKLSFCLQNMKQLYMAGLRQTQTQQDSKMRLVGALKYYNSWVCCHGNEIKVVNPHRIEETLLHQELMENHIIPATKLENTIGLNEKSFGKRELFEKLLEMVPSNRGQTYVYIEDKQLKANGIEIRCHMDQDSQPVLEIVGLATCMPMYGVKDLQEILEQITHSEATTVGLVRPLKVSFYLQGEAVRMIRQRPVHRSREDMLELLQQFGDSLPADCVTCLHNKPFIQTVYNLNDIPASQNM
ncbi:PMS1 protein homolog 1-like [Ruditapes philippinarum]|uniref:PMS1 protein homolog 1-like n=1 Tax=Ruditapes philippinarum TaxID=129788 RepID=UPI00295C2D16|nr:PMS1 protein homolog 1-like [Ruditapes philippinarum]